jgi:hypothetical protein
MLQQRASQNTIRHCYGPIVAVTSAMEKLIFKQEVVVYLKKWVFTELKELFHFIYKAL